MPERWKENIERMNNRMLHRGPDEGGIWANEERTVVLGHRRLSILDLTPAGSQPMHSASQRFTAVLNGEIYNFKKMAEKLIKDGKVTSFRGHSDTEIFLECIEAYGFSQALKMTKGMFAVAVYDRKERRLYLGRDRVGEKPLYYGFMNGCFLFASDIAAIRANQNFVSELDRDALNLYFRYGYIPAPYTVYKNVRKLEPGSILELDAPFTEVRQYKYWDMMEVALKGQSNLFKGTEEEAADRLEELLLESIRGQMVADVPVGAFLSGGIDSSTVAALMQSVSSEKIRTFSIGFQEQAYNEAPYAKQTAQYLGTDHTELYISDEEAMEVIPRLPYIYGEPFADSSQIPTYLVSRLAREKVTVSLSGDAGDELFCGYKSYESVRQVWGKIGRIHLKLRRAVKNGFQHPLLDSVQKLNHIGFYIDSSSPEELYERAGNACRHKDKLVMGAEIPAFTYNSYPYGYIKNDIESNIMLMDLLMYHPDDILVKVDRSGMAVSLESRIPLLDRDIIEYVWTLPLSFKADHVEKKKLLKKVLYRYVPRLMMERPKKGFSVPVEKWIREGKLREWAEDMLSSRTLKAEGILNIPAVEDLWKNFTEKGAEGRRIWYLLMFEEWMKENRAS